MDKLQRVLNAAARVITGTWKFDRGQPSTTCNTLLPAQHLWPSGFFSCWPHCLELSAGFDPGPDHE